MSVTYKDSANRITIEEAQRLYKEHEICVIINDGRHVTLKDEYMPLASGE